MYTFYIMLKSRFNHQDVCRGSFSERRCYGAGYLNINDGIFNFKVSQPALKVVFFAPFQSLNETHICYYETSPLIRIRFKRTSISSIENKFIIKI